MIKKLLPRSEFAKNVLTLMTGTTIAQAIPIAVSPILTRIYTPDDFGVFALFISTSTLVSTVATGRYEYAIMLPKKPGDAANIFALSIAITISITLLSLLLVSIFNQNITDFLGNRELGRWLYLIPATVLLTGVYQSLNFWSNRNREYKSIAASKVLQSVTVSSANIGMGFGGLGAAGLITGSILGQAASVSVLMRMFSKKYTIYPREIKMVKALALAKKYIDFPRINMLHSFADMAKGFVVNIILVKFYSTFILGQFYMINRILLIPSSLIGSSLSQVLFREISDKYNAKEDFSADVKNMILKLALFAAIPFLIIFLFSEPLFTFVFGENWAVAGELASSYALFVFFQFIASPVSIVPLVVNRQKEAFVINMAGTSIYIGSIVAGYLIFNDLSKSLLLLSVSMAFYFIFLLLWIYKISTIYAHSNYRKGADIL
jgi:O-antigen/teichoic acid export membrane protein